MKSLKYILLAILGLGLFFSCDREYSDFQGDEMAKFNAWIQVKNIPAEALKPSGLYYISNQEGTGLSPEKGDFLVYSIKEKSLSGYVYFSNEYVTAKLYDNFDINFHFGPLFTKYEINRDYNAVEGYPINSVSLLMVKGVYEGLSYMKEGGKATLIMPSKLAYGRSGLTYSQTTRISPYESLIYEVELIKVVKDPRAYENELLQTYVNTNYPGLEMVNDSIYYVQLSPPTVDTVTVAKDSIVYVYFKGKLLNGYVFDTNIDSVAKKLGRTFSSTDSLTVTIGKEVIKGFSLALTQMKKGEWGRAIIPSYSGYDSIAQKSIPPFSTLIYDIYFVDKEIVPAPKSK